MSCWRSQTKTKLIAALCLGRSGAPSAFASTIVNSMVTPKIEYGSFIHGPVQKCLFKKLDTTLHAIVRKTLGCLKSTASAAVYYEMEIQFLHSRRRYLLARYFAKKLKLKSHIIFKGIINHHNPDVCPRDVLIPDSSAFLTRKNSWRMTG